MIRYDRHREDIVRRRGTGYAVQIIQILQRAPTILAIILTDTNKLVIFCSKKRSLLQMVVNLSTS